jgi:hypothetical protein
MYVCYYRNRHDIDRSHDSIKVQVNYEFRMTNIFIEVLYCHVIYQYHVYFQQYFYTVM